MRFFKTGVVVSRRLIPTGIPFKESARFASYPYRRTDAGAFMLIAFLEIGGRGVITHAIHPFSPSPLNVRGLASKLEESQIPTGPGHRPFLSPDGIRGLSPSPTLPPVPAVAADYSARIAFQRWLAAVHGVSARPSLATDCSLYRRICKDKIC